MPEAHSYPAREMVFPPEHGILSVLPGEGHQASNSGAECLGLLLLAFKKHKDYFYEKSVTLLRIQRWRSRQTIKTAMAKQLNH